MNITRIQDITSYRQNEQGQNNPVFDRRRRHRRRHNGHVLYWCIPHDPLEECEMRTTTPRVLFFAWNSANMNLARNEPHRKAGPRQKSRKKGESYEVVDDSFTSSTSWAAIPAVHSAHCLCLVRGRAGDLQGYFLILFLHSSL